MGLGCPRLIHPLFQVRFVIPPGWISSLVQNEVLVTDFIRLRLRLPWNPILETVLGNVMLVIPVHPANAQSSIAPNEFVKIRAPVMPLGQQMRLTRNGDVSLLNNAPLILV